MSKEQSSKPKEAQKPKKSTKDDISETESRPETSPSEQPISPKDLATIPKDAKILRVTRIKVFGYQKLYAICEGYDRPQGITDVHTYRKYKVQEEQPNGDLRWIEKEDQTMITSTKPRYDIDFTKETGKALMDRCVKDSVNPKFSFNEGSHSTSIRNKENFLGDFDAIVAKARKGEVV